MSSLINKKIILLNGPPASGKDSIADGLCLHRSLKYGLKTKWHMFKDRLFGIAKSIAGISEGEWHDRYAVRHLKELPWDRLPINKLTSSYHTQRSWLMHVSEDIIKPNLGNEFFGQAAANEVMSSDVNFHVFSDSGFESEVKPLLRIPNADIYLMRLYRDGCTFDGDSRKYLEPSSDYVLTHKLKNNGTIDDAVEEICNLVGVGA